MNISVASIGAAEKRLLTVKQQIDKLKAWNEENRLTQKLYKDTSNASDLNHHKNETRNNFQKDANFSNTTADSKMVSCFNEIDEQPVVPSHTDFQSLLDAKMKEEIPHNCPDGTIKSVQKRPFLKKGEGLSRFRMSAEDFKLRKKTPTTKKKIQPSQTSKLKPKNLSVEYLNPAEQENKGNTALEAFEILEQNANDSSFCSTSSMVAQLMEDSIKSTPIKNNPRKADTLVPNLNDYNKYENVDTLCTRTLNVIAEEPTKLEESSKDVSKLIKDDKGNDVILDISDCSDQENYSDDSESTEDSSQCSCCRDSHYMSKSVSLFAEETTTVYSPEKKESSRKIHYFQSGNVCYNPTAERTQMSNDHENEDIDKDDELLKSLLPQRLRELEIEIDAFRKENLYLNNLRNNYEKEYNQFCEEKAQLLAKIRTEHLHGIKEIEEEKKQLHREKLAFDKYMKDIRHRPNKEEKEEIRLLKEEIKVLKEEMNKKESRWGAAQARIRTEMKQLRDHNTALKEEMKELKLAKVTHVPTKQKKMRNEPKKTVKIIKSNHRNSTVNNLLENFEFSDTQYVNNVKTYAENVESSRKDIDDLCKSICVSSYVNDTKSADEVVDRDSENTSDDSEIKAHNANGNIEKLYPDGRKEIWYPNGNVKRISSDGGVIKTIYYNGDIKEILTKDEIVKYFYAESKTWHSEYKNGLEVVEFPDGQVEKRFQDGSTEITYPSGIIYNILANGEEKWTHIDGTVIVSNKEKSEKKIIFPNGQIEIHTPKYKKREYPDGTVKTVYLDGSQETKYWNGRIRLKTKDGRLLSDSEVT